MLEKIRVLVVDDSAFMRVFISDMINGEADMEVVGTARNGDIAIEKVNSLRPDVITLDVEMPGKNGLEVLKEIKKSCSSEVIMLSGITGKGSSITIEALEAGAFDFIQKPEAMLNPKIDSIREKLLEKIRYAYSSKNNLKTFKAPYENIESDVEATIAVGQKINVVALGASTGGPRALYETLTKLPENLNTPVFVVQHMPAGFTRAFANRLDGNCQLKVVEAKDDELIRPGTVYVAPGGFHMIVKGDRIKLDTSPALHGVRPAVDKLLASAAENYGSGLLCCIFTGMGRDGAEGVKAVKGRGGFVIVQDEATSVIYGMPKAAYETGCVDIVLPLSKIADEIINLVRA